MNAVGRLTGEAVTRRDAASCIAASRDRHAVPPSPRPPFERPLKRIGM
jgi:hypothetical protein